MSAQPLVVVVGPTATGKSALAVRLARQLGEAEIVSADSMQVYRGFDIGSGKATEQQRGGVPHHLIDVVGFEERYSAARFVADADRVIAEIQRRGRRVVVAGGTGLYVRALLRGLFEAPPVDEEIRAAHAREAAEQGVESLYERLVEVDPETAANVQPADFVRISRALEVYEQTGETISALRAQHGFAEARYCSLQIGLDPGREALRARIEARVDEMIAAGWLDEVHALLAAGAGESHPMGALGYRHLRAHLRGELDLPEALRQTKRDTWRFARRQLNWFRHEPDVRWFARAEDVTLEGLSGDPSALT